jgi:transcriptional regulator with XRE-family HTH domain
MKVHEGHNVKRFREMRQVKQEALAFDLGDDWNQKKISLLEQKESIDPSILERISKILDVPAEYFQQLDDQHAVNIFGNTVNTNNGSFVNTGDAATFNINPLEEIGKLNDEKIALLERMIKEQNEIIARLEKLLEGK